MHLSAERASASRLLLGLVLGIAVSELVRLWRDSAALHADPTAAAGAAVAKGPDGDSHWKDWSATALLERYPSNPNMLLVPERVMLAAPHRLDEAACPLRVYVYEAHELHPAVSDLEDLVVDLIGNGTRLSEAVYLELALVRLFRTSPCRVRSPGAADAFVVPYMHGAHCILAKGYELGCKHVADQTIRDILNNLEYFDGRHHVFLSGWGVRVTHRRLLSLPLVLSIGPALVPGFSLVPTLNEHPRFQFEMDEAWWIRPRQFALAAFYGGLNPRMGPRQPRRFREYFFREFPSGSNESLGGRPIVSIQTQTGAKITNAAPIYEDTLVCPILPGDATWMRRFFDVIMMGCIPIVVEWPTSQPGDRSWHIPGGASVTKSYPFPVELFHGHPAIAVNYSSFVLTVPGNSTHEWDMKPLRAAITNLLDDPERIRELQMNLRRAAKALNFNLGLKSHTSHDAFQRVLLVLAERLRTVRG